MNHRLLVLIVFLIGSSGCAELSAGLINRCFVDPTRLLDPKAPPTPPKGVDEVVRIGSEYLAKEAYGKASSCFQHVLEREPGNYETNLRLGVTYLLRARTSIAANAERRAWLEQAKQHLGRAYMIRQSDSEAIYYLAEVAVALRNYNVAREFLKVIPGPAVQGGPALTLLGYVEKRTGNLAAAQQYFELAKNEHAPDATTEYLMKSSQDAAPPIPLPVAGRRSLVPYREFRVMVMHFSQPARATPSEHTTAIPAWLITELKKTTPGRFSVYEMGNVGTSGEKETLVVNRDNAKDFVDGYIEGTITPSAIPGNVCFTVRLANAQSHEVMYARSECVNPNSARLGTELGQIAHDLEQAIEPTARSQVKKVDGDLVALEFPKDKQISRGMVAYLEPPRDPAVEQLYEKVRDYTKESRPRFPEQPVVGELYILYADIKARRAIGKVYKGYAQPGDEVTFK